MVPALQMIVLFRTFGILSAYLSSIINIKKWEELKYTVSLKLCCYTDYLGRVNGNLFYIGDSCKKCVKIPIPLPELRTVDRSRVLSEYSFDKIRTYALQTHHIISLIATCIYQGTYLVCSKSKHLGFLKQNHGTHPKISSNFQTVIISRLLVQSCQTKMFKNPLIEIYTISYLQQEPNIVSKT